MANRGLNPPLADAAGSGRAQWWFSFVALRNRLLRNPRFQRWAARFPLTRPIAQRKSQALFDLCAGFVYSQTLFACVALDLFTRLEGGPCTVAVLARASGLPPQRLRTLLKAAAALDLLEFYDDDLVGLGMLGAALLGNPGVTAMIAHHHQLYADLADPVALLAEGGGGGLARFWPYAQAESPTSIASAQAAAYTDLMAASQGLIAEDILAAWRFDRHHHVLDVGGGNAHFAQALAKATPGIAISVFDLPAVIALADQRLSAPGLRQRITTHGGDFFRDPLPPGADLVTLLRILHDHDDDKALALLRQVHRCLPPGGHVLVAEPMALERGAARRVGDAYFGLYLLAMGSGRPRSMKENCALLRAAGFQPRPLKTPRPMLTQAVVGIAAAR